MSSFNGFWLLVILLGFSMAIDLFIATVSRFHDPTLNYKNWALPLALTHSAFPAISFALFWFVGNQSNNPQLILGLSGFILITIVVQEIFFEALGKKPIFDLSGFLSWLFRLNRLTSQRTMLILSVSWDALGCGAVVTGQAEAGQWSLSSTVVAFVIYGLIAGLTAGLAVHKCVEWRKSNFHDSDTLGRVNFWGVFATLSVISGFGFMSLWFAFDREANLYISMLITTTIFSFLFIVLRKKLWREAEHEAVEAIES